MARPAAVLWDLASHDYVLDATTGAYVEAHPVDAAVTIRLGFRRGTIAGDPETGHTLDKVDIGADYATRVTDIERRQRASLGDLLTDGKVEIVSIQHEVIGGALFVLTKYRNLVTGLEGIATNG